ncbi:MAG: YdcF family protein [Acidobacteriota bacterium]
MLVALAVPRLGPFLRAEDPLAAAEVISVLGGMPMERVLEASDLFHEGWAPRILLSRQAPDGGERLLLERGIDYALEPDRQRAALVALGVPDAAIDILPDVQLSTAQEADSLAAAVASRGWRRVIVVTSNLHTRRAGLVMRRRLAPLGAEVIVRGSRYDRTPVDGWWRHRGALKFVPFELQRLALYWVGIAD